MLLKIRVLVQTEQIQDVSSQGPALSTSSFMMRTEAQKAVKRGEKTDNAMPGCY